MKVEFSAKFSKDLDSIKKESTKQAILATIEELEQAENLSDLRGLKKLVGHSSAFRIRIGDYRLGFFFEKDGVLLGRIAHRKDIYSLFP
jgi:mRNA interferase RelE/StbE